MRSTTKVDRSKSISSQDAITYVWLTGHIKNVGDSVLRRPYIHAIKSVSEVNVWGGARPQSNGYLLGLDLDEKDISPTFFHWYRDLAKDIFSRRVNFAFNAGEFRVSKAYLLGMIALLPLLLVLKIRRGKILWVGAAIAETKSGFIWPFKIFAKMADLIRWRDSESSSVFFEAKTMPDWAFSLGDISGNDFRSRNSLLISLRGDRPYPSETWLQSVEKLAVRLELEIGVIVQVEEDQEYGERIAERLQAPLVGWENESHKDQEKLVRESYKKAKIVFSDRLHALIMASTEGAVPLGWCESSTSKISKHFSLVNAPWVSVSQGEIIGELADLTLQQVSEWEGETATFVSQAQNQLEQVVEEIRTVL